jgi:putative ABC transport system permease protein
MTARRTSRRGELRLRRRGLVAQWGALVVVSVLLAVVTAAGVSAARLAVAVPERDLRQTVAGASPAVRDLVTAIQPQFPYTPEQAELAQADFASTWPAVPPTLQAARHAVPAALRAVLDAGHIEASATGAAAPGKQPDGFVGGGTGVALPFASHYRLQTSPELEDDVRMVAGRWPRTQVLVDAAHPLQVALSTRTARTFRWQVGRTQQLSLPGSPQTIPVRLVGIVEARHPRAEFWRFDAARLTPYATYSSQLDETVHGTLFVSPGTWPSIATAIGGTTVQTWIGVRPSAFHETDLDAVRRALAVTLSTPTPLQNGAVGNRSILFTTDLPALLALHDDRTRASAAVTALSTSGPLGVATIAVLLAIQGMLDRRRAVRALMRDRGATVLELAGGAARDVAVAAVPAAVVGALVAVAAVPVIGSGTASVVVPVLVALGAPLVTAGLVAVEVFLTVRRRPVVRRFRWVLEVLLVALVAAAGTVVLQRGTGSRPGGASGVDPLVTVTPLLLAAAVLVVLIRVRPWAARRTAALVRRRGAAAVVGAAEGSRGGAAPAQVLATLIAATSIGVLADVVLSSASAAELSGGGSRQTLDRHVLTAHIDVIVVGGLVLSAVLTAAAVVLTVASAAPARRARDAMLRSLGFTARERVATTLWELGPRVALGVGVGVLLGVAEAVLVTPAVVPHVPHAPGLAATTSPLSVLATAALFAVAAGAATLGAVLSDRSRSGSTDEGESR